VTLSQLGNAYNRRLRGDRTDNVERALEYYRQALAVRDRESDPTRWGITQHNLGVLYRARPSGDRQENLRRSVAALEAALDVRPREQQPEFWAMTVRELGVSQVELAGNAPVDAGVRSLTSALEVYTRRDAPLEWSHIRFELAVAAHEHGGDDEAELILDDLLAGDELERDLPLLWARVATLAARVKWQRGIDRTDEALVRRAVELAQAGAERLLAHGDLSAGRSATIDLGNRLLSLGHAGPAAAVYEAALRADSEQYAASLSLASRGHEVGETEGVAARAALALVRDGRPRRAVEVLERSRGRMLGDALARDRADLTGLLDGDDRGAAAARRYVAAAQRVRELEQEERQRGTAVSRLDDG
jgi:hypothetical protein